MIIGLVNVKRMKDRIIMEAEEIAKAIEERTDLQVTCLYDPVLKGYTIYSIGYIDKTPYGYNRFFDRDFLRGYECLVIESYSRMATIAFNKRNDASE